MMKNKTIVLITLLIIMMLLSFGLILIYNKNVDSPIENPSIDEEIKEKEPENIVEDGLTLTELKDHNRHYLLQDLISKYIIYVRTNDVKMYDIILDDFQNSISNIFNNKTYHSDKVRYIKVNDRITKYNVKGYLNTVTMGDIGEQSNFDVTIFLDNVNMTYQIALQYDYDKNITDIPNNLNNQYTMKSMSNQYIASLYFSNLKDKILRKDKNIADIIINYENLEKLDEIIYQSIDTYRLNESTGEMNLIIKDKNDTRYEFNIKSVLNYTVKIY